MTKPVYKVEIWQNSSLLHTLTDDVWPIYFKETVTDSIGTFSFSVPTKKNGSYSYSDIALNDTVKIWLGYDAVSGDPNFVGKVTKITGPLKSASGYTRQISGLSQGEVLLRRLKRQKSWSAVNASDIVTEIANDLGLGTAQIEADTNLLSLNVKAQPYFDVLRKVSDYWVDASNQVKKDFYVDVNNDLVWKTRPLRTSGVETLTVGSNIRAYTVTRDVYAVKNKVYVYGAFEKNEPSDLDGATEAVSNSYGVWTEETGGTIGTNSENIRGSKSIQGQRSGSGILMRFTFTSAKSFDFGKDNWKQLSFHLRYNAGGTKATRVWLYAVTSTGNHYLRKLTVGAEDGWVKHVVPMGPTEADWITIGSPDWNDIAYLDFYIYTGGTSTITGLIDSLYWTTYYSGLAVESPTPAVLRELEYISDNLKSDSECSQRAETLLYQLQTEPTQAEITTAGNMNILVGDRLPLTIPAENISAENFDVISVEHLISEPSGFVTKLTASNSMNIRTALVTNPARLMASISRAIRELSREEKYIKP